MVNSYVINSLDGHDHYIKQCTCGFMKKLKKTNVDMFVKVSKQEYCPQCGTPLMKNFLNKLTFAPVIQTGNIAHVKTYNKACFFEIKFYNIYFASKIDFQKKAIKVDKRTEKNKMVKVVFDATQKQEDFLKYYDSDNNEIDEETFFNKFGEHYYKLEDTQEIKRKFYLISNVIEKSIGPKTMKRLINYLKEQNDFFVKYEQIIKSNIDPYLIQDHIDLSKTNPIDMLGVRPFTFKYIREQNENMNRSLLKTIKVMEEKIGDQAVNYLQTFGKKQECLNISYMNSILDLICEADLSVNKLYKYIYKDVPTKQFITSPTEIITLLRDSFEMSKDLGLVFNKNSKTLRRYHDELVEEHKTIEDEILSKKFKRQMETKEYLKYEEPNSDYCIVVPTESQELVKEGQALKHCVGSYIKKVAEGKSYIVFLRKKETPDESYTTIEINQNDQILQIRKKHNASLTEADAISFVKNWIQKNHLFCTVV